ncbi:NADH dehydrogenase [ubiquinone] 1 alpha subcomplex subunit 11-like [Eriocheir sinensis]|uniref:NADH dehydrogenase [ubiquinone] 1 alpha subcomplex subunit 11-like n=1 Tax=Eriocheir sinensis TaxID=95602 RepID=UPI0021C6032C|nr:NADH dehydrogenase [ubiquinone] 1 alpha subcomplex subunit 11-like [Eriocheir sinensis]
MGYEDHPDGKDCFHKITVATKYTGFLGLVASTVDVLMLSKTQGYVPTLGCYVKTTVPAAAAGATFAAVTCASTTMRGKDDKINYFLGGASAGGIYGFTTRSFRVGIPLAFLLGVAATVYKDSKDNGWELIPCSYNREMGMIDPRKYDFTLTKER